MKKNTHIKVLSAVLADEDHQVLRVSVVGQECSSYQPRPCTDCPWRVDAVGAFPAEAFRISAPTSYDASLSGFGCHTSGKDRPKACAGFLLSTGAEHNISVRLRRMKHGPEQVSAAGLELFSSYREMAIANGVDADDPALESCL